MEISPYWHERKFLMKCESKVIFKLSRVIFEDSQKMKFEPMSDEAESE